MTEMKFSASLGDDPGTERTSFGPIAVGVLLVGIGGAMLAERLNLLPQAWRLQIWPVLLMAFGVARLLQPRRRGRRGLVFVLGGAWWFAVLSGWLSAERTWPLLVVALGADVVAAAMTSQPGQPAGSFSRQRSGGLGFVLAAIVIGSFISAGGGRGWSQMVDPNGQLRSISVAGRTEHHVELSSLRDAEVWTVMGRNTIDLRDLPATAPATVTVNGLTAMGTTTIRVPPDWTVDMEPVTIMGRARDTRRREGAAFTAPASPHRLVVRGTVLMGTLSVTP